MKKSSVLLALQVVLSTTLFASPSLYDLTLGNVVGLSLEEFHFNRKPVDDAVSAAAFEQYLNALDFGRQFLTVEDIEQLEKYREDIDNQMFSGDLAIIELGEALVKARIEQVRTYVTERISKSFSLERGGSYQTDVEKRAWARNTGELYQRWDDILLFDIIGNYLDLEGEEADGRRDIQKEAVALTKTKYLGTLGFRLQQDRSDHLAKFFNSIMIVYDNHTSYLSPRREKRFKQKIGGTFYGIGAMLQLGYAGDIEITKIIPGSPAWKGKRLQGVILF